MGRDRSVTIIVSAILLATVFLAAGLLTSPIYSSEGGIEGEWELVYVKGYGPEGDPVSQEIDDPAYNLVITKIARGAVSGTIAGTTFTGASDTDGSKSMLRFNLSSGGIEAEAVGGLSISGVLNLVVAIYNSDGTPESYSLLYTRDGKLPHMIDSFSQDITGDWILNSVIGDDSDSLKMTITSQMATTACGEIAYNEDPAIGFRSAFSVLEIGSMSWGLLVDDNGNIWNASVKKGLMILYSTEVSAGGVNGTAAYMVRNLGNTSVVVPLHAEGKTWNGTEGYKADGAAVSAQDYSVKIEAQDDYVISGKLVHDGNEYNLIGSFLAAYQNGMIGAALTVSAEICINIGGTEVQAMLFVHGNDTVILSVFSGTLPGSLISMELVV
jgi:hypothetical protein